MRLICPACGSAGLAIILSLELPPDAYDDEITLQVVECAGCGFHGLAVYRESRHGALDSEAWRYEGYRVSEEDFRAIADAIQRCPKPADSRCQCSTHRALGQQTGYSWDGLQQSGVKVQAVFDIGRDMTG